MGWFTIKITPRDTSDDAHTARLAARHVRCYISEYSTATCVFYQDDIAVAERVFVDKSHHYVIDAAENWCRGILDCVNFDLEERLRA